MFEARESDCTDDKRGAGGKYTKFQGGSVGLLVLSYRVVLEYMRTVESEV